MAGETGFEPTNLGFGVPEQDQHTKSPSDMEQYAIQRKRHTAKRFKKMERLNSESQKKDPKPKM
ncbi:MAG: hypothetical protein KDK51_06170 [Deltaproteobacteria bacterium]|nr:hypothetical protein [Deltaproteobacteria bacterium]